MAIAFAVTAAPAVAAPGDILVADEEAFGGEGGVIRVDPETGRRSVLSSNSFPEGPPTFGGGGGGPRGIAIDSNGEVLVADIRAFGGAGGVIQVNPESGVRSTLSSNAFPEGPPYFENPSGIALESDGSILIGDVGCSVACFSPAPADVRRAGAVMRLDPESGRRTLVSANSFPEGPPEFENPLGLVLRADGEIVVADPDFGAPGSGLPGALIRVNPAGGARSLLSSNSAPEGLPRFSDPNAAVVHPDDHLMVVDPQAYSSGGPTTDGPGGLIRVGPTGIRSLFSANLVPEGPPTFKEPVGVATDAEGQILVTEQGEDFGDAEGPAGVYRVDPVSGRRTLLSSNSFPEGEPEFEDPYGIAIEPASAELGSSRAALRGSRVEISMDCEAGADCEGTIELRTPGAGSPREAVAARKSVKLGSAKFRVKSGKDKKVKVKLRKKGKKLFKKRSKVKANATIEVPITAAASQTTVEKLKIKKK